MFAISEGPINTAQLKQEISEPDSGALVEFSGTVRNQNHGRAVIALEYEGAPELAAAEFARIEAEAQAAFTVRRIYCVHRVGLMKPGDTAVWIGVTALHREAAFSACQFVINQLKQRLPIWKKEFYADGDSGWINAP